MEKGHIELGEILFVALLIIGIATAIIIMVDGDGNPAELAPSPGNASEAAPAGNVPAPASDGGNASCSPPAQEPAPPAVTNKTLGALVNDGLEGAEPWFYSTGPKGNFDVDTYGWAMGVANDSPDAIPIKKNDLRAVEVRFNGRYDDALRAFAFRNYVSSTLSEPARLYAVAVFISNSTLIDAAAVEFDIQYDPYPEGPQILEDCSVLNSTSFETPAGSPVKVYDITCKIMYGVYP